MRAGAAARRRPAACRGRAHGDDRATANTEASDSCLVWPVQGQDEAADARSRGFQNLPLCCQLARHFCETALRDVLVRRTRVWCLCFIRVFYTRRRRRRSVRPSSLGLVPVPLPALPVLVLVHLLHALELDRGCREPLVFGVRERREERRDRAARRRPDGGAEETLRGVGPATLGFNRGRSGPRPVLQRDRTDAAPGTSCHASSSSPENRRRAPEIQQRRPPKRPDTPAARARSGRGIDAPGLERRAASRPPRRGGRRARVGETRARARRNDPRGSVAARRGAPTTRRGLVSPEPRPARDRARPDRIQRGRGGERGHRRGDRARHQVTRRVSRERACAGLTGVRLRAPPG